MVAGWLPKSVDLICVSKKVSPDNVSVPTATVY